MTAVELSVFDLPPPEVQRDLEALRLALDTAVPPRHLDRNLLVATWNIRRFGSLTRKWTADANDNPKRDLRGLLAIREILSRFDVIAVQEVTGDLRALRDLLKALGPHWSFLMTDITLGAAGNDERMAYLFDTRRVQLSGLAGELVVPPEWLAEISADALTRQFVRTPYAVSFRAGAQTFILVTAHVDYGDRAADRIPELRGIARWLAEWADRSSSWHHDLIVLGDFNIDRSGDELWQAFTSTGLTAPEALNDVRRSIFTDPGEPDNTGKFYDQIAWFASDDRRRLNMTLRAAGGFDFLPFVYTDTGLTRNSVSHRISDHYPLWVEFGA